MVPHLSNAQLNVTLQNCAIACSTPGCPRRVVQSLCATVSSASTPRASARPSKLLSTTGARCLFDGCRSRSSDGQRGGNGKKRGRGGRVGQRCVKDLGSLGTRVFAPALILCLLRARLADLGCNPAPQSPARLARPLSVASLDAVCGADQAGYRGGRGVCHRYARRLRERVSRANSGLIVGGAFQVWKIKTGAKKALRSFRCAHHDLRCRCRKMNPLMHLQWPTPPRLFPDCRLSAAGLACSLCFRPHFLKHLLDALQYTYSVGWGRIGGVSFDRPDQPSSSALGRHSTDPSVVFSRTVPLCSIVHSLSVRLCVGGVAPSPLGRNRRQQANHAATTRPRQTRTAAINRERSQLPLCADWGRVALCDARVGQLRRFGRGGRG